MPPIVPMVNTVCPLPQALSSPFSPKHAAKAVTYDFPSSYYHPPSRISSIGVACAPSVRQLRPSPSNQQTQELLTQSGFLP